MTYALFLGCTVPVRALNYELSVRKVAAKLGMEFVDVEDFLCCGYPIGAVWIMDVIWFSIFLAWLIKTVILKYGGPRLYRTFRPFFLGLILGQFVAAGMWLVIDYFTGTVGNIVFWV